MNIFLFLCFWMSVSHFKDTHTVLLGKFSADTQGVGLRCSTTIRLVTAQLSYMCFMRFLATLFLLVPRDHLTPTPAASAFLLPAPHATHPQAHRGQAGGSYAGRGAVDRLVGRRFSEIKQPRGSNRPTVNLFLQEMQRVVEQQYAHLYCNKAGFLSSPMAFLLSSLKISMFFFFYPPWLHTSVRRCAHIANVPLHICLPPAVVTLRIVVVWNAAGSSLVLLALLLPLSSTSSYLRGKFLTWDGAADSLHSPFDRGVGPNESEAIGTRKKLGDCVNSGGPGLKLDS